MAEKQPSDHHPTRRQVGQGSPRPPTGRPTNHPIGDYCTLVLGLAWRDGLLQEADRCETTNPTRSSELRLGAVALMPQRLEEYQERAAIMEYDGGLTRAQAEANALRVVSSIEYEKPT